MEIDSAPTTSRDGKFMSKSEQKVPNRAQPLHKFQFAEMNLRHTGNADSTLNLVKRAIRMGYDSVVINVDIGDPFQKVDHIAVDGDMETSQPPKKKKKKGQNQTKPIEVIPDPFLVDEQKLDLSNFESSEKRFRQFSRLTFATHDTTSLHAIMHHPKLKKYDLIAVRVEDEEFLTTFSTKGEFLDIITFNPVAGKVPWLFKKKIIQRCMETGIGFELTYGEALADKNERRHFLTNARLLMQSTLMGRNVFLASGTDEMICIRAPYDTANMSFLFGMNPKDARKFVAENPKQILLRAQSRKTIKGVIHISDLAHIPTPDQNLEKAIEELAKIPEFKKQMKTEASNKEDEILQIF